jgi:hypothetical protein
VNHIQRLSDALHRPLSIAPYRCWASSYRCPPQPTWAAYRRVLVEPDLNDQRAEAASPCRPSQPVPASSRPYDARRAVQRRQGRNLGIFPIIFRLSCSGEGCSSPLAVGVYRARTWGFFWQRARVARNQARARGGHRGGGLDSRFASPRSISPAACTFALKHRHLRPRPGCCVDTQTWTQASLGSVELHSCVMRRLPGRASGISRSKVYATNIWFPHRWFGLHPPLISFAFPVANIEGFSA